MHCKRGAWPLCFPPRRTRALTLRDLSLLCDLQEDAYDAVKSHMFDLLAVVASKCQSSQLDMLFAKLERRQVHNVQDAERLLALLEKLSAGDKQVCAVLRVLTSGCDRASTLLQPALSTTQWCCSCLSGHATTHMHWLTA